MKNKENKKTRMMLKETFTKDQLLVLKRYNRLLACDIPYAVINRAYKRYLSKVDEYVLINEYPNHWFSKSKDVFCNAVRTYIMSQEVNHKYAFGARGYVQVEIVRLSEIDKYLDRRR